MKSILALKEKDKEAIGIELLDLVKFFDRESLVDAMDELHKSEVTGKVYKLIFEMNKNTRITVRTPVGESTKRETAGNVSQGSVDAAIVSSNNLSLGVEDFFRTSEFETQYGSLRVLPQIYQDDLFCFLENPLYAQLGNDRFESLAEAKLLEYNLLIDGFKAFVRIKFLTKSIA